jgi:hypothetical protein
LHLGLRCAISDDTTHSWSWRQMSELIKCY